jgi:polar amino acid transport system substrate-binding protein
MPIRDRMKILILSILSFILGGVTAVSSAETLNLVTGNNYPPFTDENLPQRGMATEIVALAFERVGYQTRITFRPWRRGYEETKKGLFAATFPYIKTDDRLKHFYYSQPINTVYTRIFVTKDSRIKRLQDLKGQRICIPLGYGVSKRFDDLFREPSTDREVNPVDLEGCLRMMVSGRKDFFIINEINGWMTIQKIFHSKDGFRTLDTEFEEESHHLIVSKHLPNGRALLYDFNRGLEKLKQDGILQRIIRRHLKGILD